MSQGKKRKKPKQLRLQHLQHYLGHLHTYQSYFLEEALELISWLPFLWSSDCSGNFVKTTYSTVHQYSHRNTTADLYKLIQHRHLKVVPVRKWEMFDSNATLHADNILIFHRKITFLPILQKSVELYLFHIEKQS